MQTGNLLGELESSLCMMDERHHLSRPDVHHRTLGGQLRQIFQLQDTQPNDESTAASLHIKSSSSTRSYLLSLFHPILPHSLHINNLVLDSWTILPSTNTFMFSEAHISVSRVYCPIRHSLSHFRSTNTNAQTEPSTVKHTRSRIGNRS